MRRTHWSTKWVWTCVRNVVGDFALTALAPALPSPLRKTAPYGRPVHRLGDRAGRSPGSRVSAFFGPAFPVSQWPSWTLGSPLTVAGAATAFFEFVKLEFEVPVFPLSSPESPGKPAP